MPSSALRVSAEVFGGVQGQEEREAEEERGENERNAGWGEGFDNTYSCLPLQLSLLLDNKHSLSLI
jgi:hypothetical protein